MTRPADKRDDPALGLSFEVAIDGLAVTQFTACEGLGAEYELEEYRAGGNNDFVHVLPGRIAYSRVRLTRAVDGHSGQLAAWFSSVQHGARPATARITAFSAGRKPIAHWNLSHVWPARYTGPSLSSDGSSYATETLELVHHGFTSWGQ